MAEESPRCPKCSLGMDIVATTRARVFGCQRCGGMWLDNSATQIVKWAGLHAELLEAATKYDETGTEVEQRATHTGNYRQSPKFEKLCQVCRHRLAEERLAGHLVVDRCLAHGAFFDRRELRALSVAAKHRRDLSAKEVEGLLQVVTQFTDAGA